jgi:hypothetical protein
LAGELAWSGLTLLEMQRAIDAEPLLRECLIIREVAQPEDWSTFNTQSLLGAALLAQYATSTDEAEKAPFLAEAEPLLVGGYEGMKQREDLIPPQAASRIPEALDRLIDLYAVLKKTDEVQKYRDLRAAYPTVREQPFPIVR